MTFNKMAPVVLAFGALLTTAGPGKAATQIIDISALSETGTTVALAAGSYTASFIGRIDGGAYDAWNPWGSTTGCDGAGMNCNTGYAISLAIDFGYGAGTFSHVDGYQWGQLVGPGDNRLYSTAEAALAQIQTANLVRAPLSTASDLNTYVAAANPIAFTLAGAQSVNFFILDYPYGDNLGGVSIRLDSVGGAVPEPANWALMIAGFGFVGTAMRRAKTRAAIA